MQIKTVEITKCVRFNAILTDKFKQSRFSVNFVTERKKENCAKNSLLPSVLVRGSKNYPTIGHICRRLDYLYGAGLWGYNKSRGELQLTGISINCLADKYAFDDTKIFKETLDLLCDVLFEPLSENGAFLKEIVDGEKEKQIRYIRSKINNKNRYAQRRCEEIMCAGENYAISTDGSEEDTAKITPKELFSHYEKLKNEAQVEIFYTGSMDFDTILGYVKEKFKALDHEVKKLAKTSVIREVEKVKYVSESLPISQGRLCIGFRGIDMTHKDYPAFLVMRTILGGSGVSKLFVNVREKMSLCYTCFASLDGAKGIMTVYAGIDPANRERAEKAIFEQIERIKNGDISDNELALAKLELSNTYKELYDSPAALESWFIGRRLAGIEQTPEEFARSLVSVEKEQVIDSASYLLCDTVYFLEGTAASDDAIEEE